MYSNSILALTGALLSVVAAVPMADNRHHHHHVRRDIVWVTQTEEQVVTVPVTKTVWIEPGETPPTEAPAASSAPAVAQVYNPPPQEAAAPASSSAPAAAPAAPQYAQSSPEVQSQAAPTSQYVAPSPTSTYVAPAPATTQAPAEAPASSSAPAAQAPASSAAASSAASYSSGSGSSSGGTGVSGMAAAGKSYTGDLTWYQVGMGSCGETSSPSDHIVAVSHVIMSAYNGANPNANPLCNKYVSIKGVDGSTYQGKIVDTCPGCDQASLDLSEDFFNLVTNNGDGRVHDIEWSFT